MVHYYEVDFHISKKTLKGLVHFTLPTNLLDQSDYNGKLQPQIYATFSKLKSQIEYDVFRNKVFQAIEEYDIKLGYAKASLLLYVLQSYRSLIDIRIIQDDIYNSHKSISNAGTFADLIMLYDRNQKAISNRKLKMETKFTISNIEFRFESIEFTDWLINLIRENVTNGNFPLSLGLNMQDLQEVLSSHLPTPLKKDDKSSVSKRIIEGRDFLSWFCLSLHEIICALQGQQDFEFNTQRLKLYITIARAFDIPFADSYFSSTKAAKDKFRLLLKRAMKERQKA